MSDPQIGQCARCGGNLAACVRGCRGKELEKIMSEGTKRPTRRWDVDKQGCDYERADGMYVLYTDHVTELDALRAQLSACELERNSALLDSVDKRNLVRSLRAQLAERDARIRELEADLERIRKWG